MHAPDPTRPSTRTPGSPGPVDDTRPFGTHLRMSWWKPVVIVVVPPLVLVVLQVLLYQLVGVVEGSDDPMSPEFTPLKFLAINVSVGATGVLAVALVVRLAGVPWRSLLSAPRGFDARRLGRYLLVAAVLVGAGIGVTAVAAPQAPGWTAFGVSGTTVLMLLFVVVSTPVQAAGEELMFRGAMLPAAASWVRAVRPALAVGVTVSGLAFAVVHGSTDPWLFAYFTVFGICTGLMAVLSRGLEAPIAFHVANNVVTTTVNTLMADGAAFPLDRSTDTGDASLLILVAVNVAMLLAVGVHERWRGDPDGA